MVIKRGYVIRNEGIVLPEGNIADTTDGHYEEAARTAPTIKYLQRVR